MRTDRPLVGAGWLRLWSPRRRFCVPVPFLLAVLVRFLYLRFARVIVDSREVKV